MIRYFTARIRDEELLKFMWQLKTIITPPSCRKTMGYLSTNLVGHYHVPCLVIHRMHLNSLLNMRKNVEKAAL